MSDYRTPNLIGKCPRLRLSQRGNLTETYGGLVVTVFPSRYRRGWYAWSIRDRKAGSVRFSAEPYPTEDAAWNAAHEAAGWVRG